MVCGVTLPCILLALASQAVDASNVEVGARIKTSKGFTDHYEVGDEGTIISKNGALLSVKWDRTGEVTMLNMYKWAAYGYMVVAQAYSCTEGSGTSCRTCKDQAEMTGDNQCAACNDGYRLDGTQCKAYSCREGPGASCGECKAQADRNGDNQCKACNKGYQLSGTECKAYSCSEGSGASCATCKAQANRTGDNQCKACNNGYLLDGTQCKDATLAPCFERNIKYSPIDMSGQKRTVESSAATCQQRCAVVSGCVHFSWWGDGGCHLQGTGSSLQASSGVIAGPPSCPGRTTEKVLKSGSSVRLMLEGSLGYVRLTPRPLDYRDINSAWVFRPYQLNLGDVFIIEKDSGSVFINSGDAVYLKSAYLDKHIDVDARGNVRCRWNDWGAWQKLVIQNAKGSGLIGSGDTIYLKAHTGNYIGFQGFPLGGAFLKASSSTPLLSQTLTIENAGVLRRLSALEGGPTVVV